MTLEAAGVPRLAVDAFDDPEFCRELLGASSVRRRCRRVVTASCDSSVPTLSGPTRRGTRRGG